MAEGSRQLSTDATKTGPVGANLDTRSMSTGRLLGLFYVLNHQSLLPRRCAEAQSLPASGLVPLFLEAAFDKGGILLLRLQRFVGAGQ